MKLDGVKATLIMDKTRPNTRSRVLQPLTATHVISNAIVGRLFARHRPPPIGSLFLQVEAVTVLSEEQALEKDKVHEQPITSQAAKLRDECEDITARPVVVVVATRKLNDKADYADFSPIFTKLEVSC